MTSKLTRERIEQIANFHRAMTLPPSHDEIEELASMELAAMDSEPVAWMHSNNDIGIPAITVSQKIGHYWMAEFENVQPLYRHAQPAPDGEQLAIENFRSAMEGIGHIRRTLEETFGGLHGTHVEPDVLAECKAICDAIYAAYGHEQPAQVVPEEKPMPNPLSMYAVDAVAAIAEAKGWNSCRAAMIQGKAEPVSLHPELSVWYGSMPESNGKSNWTAILHRKGECLSTGITIELSEYPERVRYEADRVRHIIGELKEEPDILAYDADEHSGYVKPGNSPVIPDGYVMVPKEPTEEMLRASYREASVYSATAYRAMLAASQHDTPALNSLQSVDSVAGKWIPVSERMPEDRISVILWDAEIGEVTSGHYSHKTQTFYHCGDAIENEITHWMPPPCAPQEVK